MTIAIGTDIVEIARIADVLERQGERFIDRILSIWYEYRATEKDKLHTYILTFDDNGDKII